MYTTIYEWEEIKKVIKNFQSINSENANDYILIDPNNIDRDFQEHQIVEKLGKRFVFTKNIPRNIEEQRTIRSNIFKSFKSVVFYNDQYLEEKLFVHLFPTGTGGF